VLSKVGNIVDFRINMIAEDAGSGFNCMHGNSECMGDIVELCVMKYFPTNQTLGGKYAFMNYFRCVASSQGKIPSNTDDCLKSSGASDIIPKVASCSGGDEGKQLMRDSISYTLARCGHHPSCRSCTMWFQGKQACIEDDGKWYDCPVGHTLDAWVKAICNAYTGSDKPDACPTPAPPTPAPPPTPSPPPTPFSGWVPNLGFNCYGARGSSPAHGAKDLENPPDSSCGVMSISDCKKKCVDTTECDGVTVSGASGGLYNCYRKGDIKLGECDHGTGFDTYVRGNWVLGSGFNCYGARGGNPSHGAKDLENPPDSSCGVMSISDCEKKCSNTTSCDAVTVSKADGGLYNCYRKGDVVLGKCDSHTGFDTYVHDGTF